MPRSPKAYLADIVDACDAIASALRGVDADAYLASRLIRSSVEREFIIIGEAIGALSRTEPRIATSITHARFIVGFRNRLAHDYASIDDVAVFRIAQEDVGALRVECERILSAVGEEHGGDSQDMHERG